MKIKTIISDLGGVFLNRGIWLFWDCLHNKYNIPRDAAKSVFLKYYKQYFSGNISEEKFWEAFLTELGLDVSWKEERKVLLDLFQINREVAILYQRLKTKSYILVLLSDQTKEWWPFLDKKFNISSYFDFVIVSALVGVNKPDPGIYKYALTISQSDAHDTLFIDDLEQNLLPAKELGIATILFEDSKQLEKELAFLEIS